MERKLAGILPAKIRASGPFHYTPPVPESRPCGFPLRFPCSLRCVRLNLKNQRRPKQQGGSLCRRARHGDLCGALPAADSGRRLTLWPHGACLHFASRVRRMIRSVLLLSISAAIRSAAAFSVHGPVAPALRSASAAHATGRRASALRPVATPALRMMADQPDQVIDFGKVGFTDAENQVPAPSSCATPCCAHQAGALLRRRCATPRRRACRGLAISQPRSAAKQAWVARRGQLLQAPPPILARPWTLLYLAGPFGSTSQHVLPLVAIRGRTQRKRDAGAFQPVCARILTP